MAQHYQPFSSRKTGGGVNWIGKATSLDNVRWCWEPQNSNKMTWIKVLHWQISLSVFLGPVLVGLEATLNHQRQSLTEVSCKHQRKCSIAIKLGFLKHHLFLFLLPPTVNVQSAFPIRSLSLTSSVLCSLSFPPFMLYILFDTKIHKINCY